MKNKHIDNENYHYIISKEEPLSFATESIHKTLINLDYVNIDGKYKVIQVSSTISGEGKTTLLANIAYILRRRGKKVLVIDLDLRKPKIHRVFNVPNENGLTDYLSEKITFKQLIRTDKETNIDYILCGEKTVAITSILEAEKLKKLISDLEANYDYILLDAPPVLVVSDALYISKFSDGVIYVVGQGIAKKHEVKEAFSTLQKAEVNILGLVMTRYKVKNKKYGYYYEYSE